MSNFNLGKQLTNKLQEEAAQANISVAKLLEQMLRERELLRGVLDAVPTSITVADATAPNTPLTHVNPSFEKLTGYREDEAIGKPLLFFAENNDPPPQNPSLKQDDVVQVCYRKDGTPFHSRHRLHPVYNANGDLTHYIALHENVTQQPEMQEAMAFGERIDPQTRTNNLSHLNKELIFATVIQQAPDAVLITDENGSILMFNQGAEQIFGYARAEILNQSYTLLVPEIALTAHEAHSQRFIDSEDQQLVMNRREQIRGRRKDGTEFAARASVSTYHTADQTLFVIILQDISWEFATRQRLQESETRYRMISELSSDYTYAYHRQTDGRFRLAWITAAVEAITGYSRDELLRHMGQFLDVVHPNDQPRAERVWKQLVTSPTTETLEVRLNRKDGSEIIVQSRYRSVATYNANQVSHIYGVSQDITARRTAERRLVEERNLLRDIMETSPAGITVVDVGGNIIYANRRGNEIMRTTEDDVTRRDYDSPEWRHTDFDGNPWPDEKQPFVQVMQTKQPVWNIRHAIESDQGERVYLSINGVPQLDENDEIQRIVFSIEDVSVQKAWEDNLRALLEREAQLNSMKSRFISFVSHEFRNPLSVILTSTGILRKYHDRLSDEDRMSRIQTIENQVSRLDRMLDNVSRLNNMQITERPLEPVTLVLETYLYTIIEEIELAYPDTAQILYQFDDTCSDFVTDEMHFHQILTNLLTNAAKYTSSDKSIWLVVRCQPGTILITVRDEGIGIPKEDQQAMFTAFKRASNVGDIPGTGMGLVILKNSVEALGGKVDFESTVGEGTTFHVQLSELKPGENST